MIFVNQPIKFETAFTIDGTVESIAGGTVRFDYWYDGNYTDTPDGYVDGSITDPAAATAEGTLPAGENTTTGVFKVQGVLTLSGDTYRAPATCATIYPAGAGCE